LALLHRLGMGLPTAAKFLGMVSALFLLVSAARFAARCMPGRAAGVVLVSALVAGNACVAAWALGGLETPLFAALIVASIVALADWLDGPTLRRTVVAAGLLFWATLTRPEAGILAVCAGLALLAQAIQQRQLPKWTVTLLLGYALPCVAYLVWRRSYYGDWLPNTFYVKTTGEPSAQLVRGIEYLAFCAKEVGWPFVVVLVVLAFLPTRAESELSTGVRLALVTARLYVLLTVVYVARIGGDFLDLYRFLVPVFPLLFALAVRRYFLLLEHAPKAFRGVSLQVAVGIALLAWYGCQQFTLAERAMQLSEVGRREHGIEPLGWTATYARRWAATGRWLADHSKPGDWLAVGAAGAMPFYSALPNIDTFGLCDRTVAREGSIIGARPGHQRFATIEYLLRRAPTFLLINDYALDEPARFRYEPVWDQRGYVWVEAYVERGHDQAPTSFYHYLLVRRDRAAELVGAPNTRVALP